MWRLALHFALLICLLQLYIFGSSELQIPLNGDANEHISQDLFDKLEELARIVDISYCVTLGGAGISQPFNCLSRCDEFPSFELVKSWNTGPLLSDSSGYIALSHAPAVPRIIVAFRGTYSISNAIVDLSTVPQAYVPYPNKDDEGQNPDACTNCTVHSGFYASWLLSRSLIKPLIAAAVLQNPNYSLVFIGHSLGGAVAALGALEFKNLGLDPHVTTFGEPRVGNDAFVRYLDEAFHLNGSQASVASDTKFHRVTHINDPIPLLPLDEWGYKSHAGELFISKPDLPIDRSDVEFCQGDDDPNCIAGASSDKDCEDMQLQQQVDTSNPSLKDSRWNHDAGIWVIPPLFQFWHVFFNHRDYFHRLGLCVPGGDPSERT